MNVWDGGGEGAEDVEGGADWASATPMPAPAPRMATATASARAGDIASLVKRAITASLQVGAAAAERVCAAPVDGTVVLVPSRLPGAPRASPGPAAARRPPKAVRGCRCPGREAAAACRGWAGRWAAAPLR